MARTQKQELKAEPSAGRSPRLARRRLLQGGASGGGALALIAVARDAPPDGARDAPPDGGGRSSAGAEADHLRLGFAETDHVRWFYRRARL